MIASGSGNTIDRHRILRRPRIAFSTVCGTVCLLLIALWVRSHSYHDILNQQTSSRQFRVYSRKGRLAFEHIHPDRDPNIRRRGIGPLILKDLSSGRFLYSEPITGSGLPFGNHGFGFGHYAQDMTTRVFVPYWFPELVAAICAVVPWVPWSRRFSVRTLLCATTIVAVLLGAIVYAIS
jgi:hypothetical protein